MTVNEDHIVLAAEYVLGTADAEERNEAEQLMAADTEFAAHVAFWERKLGELHAMAVPVEPPPAVWDRIRSSIAEVAQAPLALPARESEAQAGAQVIVLAEHARRWRGIATLTTAAAAALAGLMVLQAYNPDLLPAALRPKPRIETRIETVQVKVPAPQPAQFVAVLQSGADAPAFIMTVDIASKSFTVRRVGAKPEPGKSFELWLVSDKFPKPLSLGVIGDSEFTARPALDTYDAETVEKATYAVTVEPEGGSPTGVATGPIVFTGKLVEAVPPGTK